MLTQKTSFACCGMLANHPGEFGWPTKRPSSECMTTLSALLKPSSGRAERGSPMLASVHQWSVMTSFTRKSCVKGPPSSTVSALRKTTVSTMGPSSPLSTLTTAASPSSPASPPSPSSSAGGGGCESSLLFTASLTSFRISATSSHLSITAPATSRRASTWRDMKVWTQSMTFLGSMTVSSSCLPSRNSPCQRSVIMRSSKG
mmetsp:Transcript_13937/g.41457  ORF Transcript_13937/g.41457 Transcript_13937/m.41457 type:complete len:202 (+) Transcript_13937:2965-3570(+)